MYQLPGAHVAKASPVEVPADFEWSRLWRGFVRRRAVFFGIFGVVYAAIVAYTLFTAPTYTTHVNLIAGNNPGPTSGDTNPQTELPLLNALLQLTGAQSSETYATLFTETPVVQQVIDEYRLHMTPSGLLAHVKVQPVQNTTLLDVAVTWSDPQSSAKVANAIAGAFVDRERQLVASQADEAIATLTQQLPQAQADAVRERSNLTRFETANNLADIQTQTQNTIDEASSIEAKMNAVQLDQRQAQGELGSVTSQLARIAPTTGGQTSVAPNPVLGQLQQQLATTNVQLQTAEQQYTDQHPTVIGLKNQIDELRREIARTPATIVAQSNTVPNPLYQQLTQQAATLRAQVAADNAQVGQLRVQRQAMIPVINSLPGKAAELFELQRRDKLAENVLNALQQKLNEANITKATALSDVTITQPASASDYTMRPNKELNLTLGSLVSLALAAALTLAFQAFDRRLRDESQIEEELELPLLASVPQLADLRSRLPGNSASVVPLGTGERLPQRRDETWLRAYAVESFLQLVTALRYSSDAERPLRRITITSPGQGDGKSTIALNTAITMAHIEPRVLLIDGDLRRPTLHSKLNRELGRGLSDVLVGTAVLEDVISPTEHEGLDLLTSGTRTPNSVKLIQSRRFDETIERLLASYRTIIVDAPALGPVIDAAILAAKSDGTVLVVSLDATDSMMVRKAIQKLQSVGANVLGTVANGTRPSRRTVYDDYFYIGPSDQLALP